MAGFDPDEYLGKKSSASFDPDAYLRGGSNGKKNPPRELTLREALISLAAPGGIGRMTDMAQKSYEGAAYDLGGNVTDQASKILPPGGAAALGTAANVGMQAIPMFVGSEFGKVAKPAFEASGRGLMKSAIKASAGNLERGKVPAAIETMLQEGVSPTNAGLAKLREKVAALTSVADNIIAPSNRVIPVAPAAQAVQGVASKATAGTMGVEEARKASDVARALYAHPAVDNLGTMSVQAAQAMKQANYKALGDAAYGLGLKPAAERDAIKAATSALKKGIETAEPAVAPVNAKISDLVNAIKVSQRRALIEGNKDVIPLGSSVATALHNPVAALGLYANSNAGIKALLARMLYSGAERIPQTVGGAAGAMVGAKSGSAPRETDEDRKKQIARILREQN